MPSMSDNFPDWPDARAARRFFNRAAPTADSADVLAREVEHRMLERLELVRVDPARILDLGCGTGQGVKLLREKYPQAEVIGIDVAESMLSTARRRRSAPARWVDRLTGRGPSWVCGDIGQLPFASRSMDLGWSNLALAWASDPPQLFRELHRTLKKDGLLMFSSYGPDTLRELRAAFAAVDNLPHTHRFVDMHDLGDMLVESGFATPVMDMETITLTYADFDGLVADLRGTGQGNAAIGRRRSLTGRGRRERVANAYESLRKDGTLPATFEIVYGHAWRGEPRQAPGEPAIVRFESRPKRGA
jgi:malonyl-CoA O-methyltransferase